MGCWMVMNLSPGCCIPHAVAWYEDESPVVAWRVELNHKLWFVLVCNSPDMEWCHAEPQVLCGIELHPTLFRGVKGIVSRDFWPPFSVIKLILLRLRFMG